MSRACLLCGLVWREWERKRWHVFFKLQLLDNRLPPTVRKPSLLPSQLPPLLQQEGGCVRACPPQEPVCFQPYPTFHRWSWSLWHLVTFPSWSVILLDCAFCVWAFLSRQLSLSVPTFSATQDSRPHLDTFPLLFSILLLQVWRDTWFMTCLCPEQGICRGLSRGAYQGQEEAGWGWP